MRKIPCPQPLACGTIWHRLDSAELARCLERDTRHSGGRHGLEVTAVSMADPAAVASHVCAARRDGNCAGALADAGLRSSLGLSALKHRCWMCILGWPADQVDLN